jgi:hypothetical protein
MNPLIRSAHADYPAEVSFTAELFLHAFEKGAWTFLEVPTALAPPVMGAWGMSPVIATVDGKTWPTTVWKDKAKRSLLPVPKKIRGKKGDGDYVAVQLRLDTTRERKSREA